MAKILDHQTTLLFKVTRQTPELITPATPTPYEIKELSEIDNHSREWGHTPGIHFYGPAPKMLGVDPAKVIKEALRRALVPYYPLAGRLREKSNKKLVVECTGEGIVFIEANADVSLEEFSEADFHPPYPFMDELLYNGIPDFHHILNSPLFLFQVTRLKCGGFILTHKMNHAIVDAISVAHFMNATSELARGIQTLSINPVWERHLLRARDPPRVTYVPREFDQIPDIPPPHDLILKRFFFGPTEITSFRQFLPTHLKSCSTFEILTAVIWRSWTIALGFHPDNEVRLRIFVNVRPLLKNPPLPDGYYGNVIVTPVVLCTAGALTENPVGYAVELVKAAKNSFDEEYVKSTIDFFVTNGRPRCTRSAHTLILSDIRHIKHDAIDFGWGLPVHYGPMTGWAGAPYPGHGSFFLRSKNSDGESGILVPMYLPALAMEMFVKEINGYLDPDSAPVFGDRA
ncbi:benzyl alcohol O-benzoyltransferase-like [Silene latifolia]|uniref:benzyl alcohol O-benzoyltransferase-like n=1 Tax=Silene latifolia TaxID=37657 RepID=UPI003D770CCE